MTRKGPDMTRIGAIGAVSTRPADARPLTPHTGRAAHKRRAGVKHVLARVRRTAAGPALNPNPKPQTPNP